MTLRVRSNMVRTDAPYHAIDRPALAAKSANPLSATPRPFVRWAGSKRAILTAIVSILPRAYRTYREPFLGGGSLFFLLEPPRAELGDLSCELMSAYRAVREDPERVLNHISSLTTDPERFYAVRSHRSGEPIAHAAEFIYLNKLCWNGLYRVNSKGRFNVPYGRPKSDNIVDATNLAACARVLRPDTVRLGAGDFEDALQGAMPGDLVFLDPPYVTRHNNNGFVDYNEVLFAWADQVRLARVARNLREMGVSVIVTNANHRDVLDLYPEFQKSIVTRSSTLASSPHGRGKVDEAILYSIADVGGR